jgi:hypothetical protein
MDGPAMTDEENVFLRQTRNTRSPQ